VGGKFAVFKHLSHFIGNERYRRIGGQSLLLAATAVLLCGLLLFIKVLVLPNPTITDHIDTLSLSHTVEFGGLLEVFLTAYTIGVAETCFRKRVWVSPFYFSQLMVEYDGLRRVNILPAISKHLKAKPWSFSVPHPFI